MNSIDRHWIKQKIAGRRGIQAKLARHMDVAEDVVSKIMTGDRQIKAHELFQIAEFFEAPSENRHDQGFSEPAPKTMAHRILESIDNPSDDVEYSNDIKIGVHGLFAQIIATVDHDGLALLRKKLDAVEMLLDQPTESTPKKY